MPARSAAQYRLMAAVAHGSAKKSGIPKSVAKEFVDATPAKKRSKFMKAAKGKK